MKKIVRKILNKFGYDIFKTEQWFYLRAKKSKIAVVGKYKVKMPGNNTLLRTYMLYPEINSHLGRLALEIANKYTDAAIVDVGANVGDTIAVIKSFCDTPILGIEGDEQSFRYLEQNTKQFSDVLISKTFLGETDRKIKVKLCKEGTNTSVIPTEHGSQEITLKSLDRLLSEPQFTKFNFKLIKTDTEGFDTIILRGAKKSISHFKPVLFFEYNPENMIAINEDGFSTLLSFTLFGYNQVVFFDRMGKLLLSTTLSNKEILTNLHNYISSAGNLITFYDVCVFHLEDQDLANRFLLNESNLLNFYTSQ